MHKIFILVLIFISIISIAAQAPVSQPNKPLSERERFMARLNKTLEESTVLEYLKKCASDIGSKKGETVSRSKYIPYKVRIKSFLDYQWFVADTGLSKQWLSEVYELLEYMYKVKDIIENAVHNHQTESAKYKQAVKYYDVAYKRFVAKVSKPEKVSLKIQRQLKVAKVKWQRAMAKKYKIKENF